MKKLLLILLMPMIGFGQQTYVPDDNFEYYLESNGMGNGILYDDYVFTNAIDTLTTLVMSSFGNDLTGIEDFADLSYLDLPFLSVDSLDLSNNSELTFLRICNSQQIIFLNLNNSFNSNLEILLYGNYNLTCVQVDNVAWAMSNWSPDPWTSFSTNCTVTTSIYEYIFDKELHKITNILGVETRGKKNEPLFYIYDDGTVEKRIVIE
tara:strand:+ start:916 stop:1536 length:621 start_codon:yes stop_codon:yes gene_type:complete